VSQGGMGAETAAPAVRKIYEGLYGLNGKPAALPGGRPPERPPVIAPDGTVAP
jgi:penicillin-binding protein 2